MASDVAITSSTTITGSTVIAIQGQAVSSSTPTDGYVLTWDGYCEEWEAKPTSVSGGLRSAYFTSSGTWTSPADVANVLVISAGGGGGGAGANTSRGGPGGGGVLQATNYVMVTPNTTYTITIGAGGAGASVGSDGSNGSDTTFDVLSTAKGAEGGKLATNCGGKCVSSGDEKGSAGFDGSNYVFVSSVASGGTDGGANLQSHGSANPNGFDGGPEGSGGITGTGGGGGGGPQGVGATGGNSGTNGTNGASAASNTGAGGGGGGRGTSTPAAGGNGGSGYLRIIY